MFWAGRASSRRPPGNVVDYSAVEALQDEAATMVEFRQGFRSMSAPTRELEKLIVPRKLAHGANPVTR